MYLMPPVECYRDPSIQSNDLAAKGVGYESQIVDQSAVIPLFSAIKICPGDDVSFPASA